MWRDTLHVSLTYEHSGINLSASTASERGHNHFSHPIVVKRARA
jgi:hypothetical protein